MADVLFVFVKEDASEAQTLASVFAAADPKRSPQGRRTRRNP